MCRPLRLFALIHNSSILPHGGAVMENSYDTKSVFSETIDPNTKKTLGV